MELRTTAAGIPSGVVLASLSVAPDDLPVNALAFERQEFRSHRLRVERGDVLSLVLSSINPVLQGGGIDPYAWAGEGFGQYPGGPTYFDRGGGFLPISWDMGFRTYVIPEPAGLSVLGVLLTGVLRVRHRRTGRVT